MIGRLLAVVALVAAVTPVPVRAQEAPVVEPEALRILEVSPWTDIRTPLRMVMQVTNGGEADLTQLSVRVSVFSRVLSRSQLRSALDEGQQTALLGSATIGAPPVAAGATSLVRFRRAMRTLSSAVNRTGVYPVEILLRHSDGETVLRTAVPYLASQPEERLNVAWVMPVTAPTIASGSGTYDEEAIRSLRLAELTQELTEIAARPAPAVTLAFDPALLTTARDLADGYTTAGESIVDENGPHARNAARFLQEARRAAAAVAELAGVPFARIDPPAVARRGPRGDLVRQVTLGRSQIEAVLGRAPNADLLVTGTGQIDKPSADALRATGASAMVLDPRSIQLPTEPFQPQLFGVSRPVEVRSAGGPLAGLVADQPLRERFDAGGQGVLLAQALIAESASAWLELPLFAGDRVLTVTSAALPAPPAIAAALDGLRGAPWVRLVSMSTAVERLEPQGDPARPIPAPVPDRPNFSAARQARRAYRTLQEITAELPPQLEDLDRLILLSQSSEWQTTPLRGAGLARAVTERVEQIFDAIRIARRSQVTLTARTGEIPVTLVNDNPFPVRVRVRLSGAKVAFPRGDSRSRDLLASRPDTIDFAVEALATGSFPLDVTIETPDGRRVIARSKLLLRSTAVSAVTLMLVGGSAIFLVVASTRRALRRKRQQRNRPTGHHAA